MTLALMLPWFPIVLGVGVGGRLLGRRRGFALGFLCAMFWIVLVQASIGSRLWVQSWTVAAVLLGALAIFLMGGWAGELPIAQTSGERGRREENAPSPLKPDASWLAPLDDVATVVDRFDDWLDEHRNDADPCPDFGEFVRSALYQLCKATHVKLYRLLSEGEELLPVREQDPLAELTRVSARHGLLGHVVTTGRSYVAGDPRQGGLIDELAARSDDRRAWVFAVSRGMERLGAVVVGHLDVVPADHKPLLRAAEQMVALFWCALAEALRCRQVGADDPESGLLNRSAFLQVAQQSVRESYALGEPIAVAVIAIEGLRELNDSGRWELADELIRETAGTLRRKVRMDDRLGRFDGSRVVWLLRRVDSELAGLIVKQVMSRLTTLCADQVRWKAHIAMRCGLAGSGCERPDLRTLVCRALAQTHRARVEKLIIASELDAQRATTGSPG